MTRGIRRAVGAVGAAASVGLLLAGLSTTATIAEKDAEAAGPDGGAGSSFVTRAQQGGVTPPTVEDVEQLCELLTSCPELPIPPQLIPSDFAACVKKMSEEMTSPTAVTFSLTIRECGLAANSCDGLKACAYRGANPTSCAGRGTGGKVVGYCDVDGRALSCWNGRVLAVRDCPRGGEMCVVRPVQRGEPAQSQCVLGPCGEIKAGEPPVCSNSGTHLLRCESGKLVSLDCAALGLKCTTLPGSEGAGCATTSPACASGMRRCEGNVSVGCHNGREVKVDCAAAGLVCNAAGGGVPVGACVAPAPPTGACNPNDAPTCDGAYIKYCSAGKSRRYFCKPRFDKCEKDGRGVHCSK